jgi:hypothetical protein
MEVVVMLVFISAILVIAGLVFYASRIRAGDFEHGDRLALLPLEPDDPPTAESPITPDPGHEGEDPDGK